MDENELFTYARDISAPFDLVKQVAREGKLPVVNFAAGGVATPAGLVQKLCQIKLLFREK